MKRRVGLLGGTFDPPHWAHLVLAETARDELELDEVWFLPAGRPPHKRGRRVSPPGVRLALLSAALSGAAGFRIEPLELERPGASFTADTLEVLAARRPEVEWWLLLGADMLADLPRWRRPRRVLELARLAVAERPGHPGVAPRGLGARFRRLGTPSISLSSSEIRRRVAAGRSIRYLVPEAVERLIRRRRLYRTAERRR
jgi:nicotinate-nucleotide adenylyltransferase